MTPEQKRKEEETGRAFHHPKALDAVMVLSAALPGIVWVLFPGSNSSKIPLLLGIPVGPGPVSTWAPSSAQVGFDCKAKPVTLWKSSSCSGKTASLRGTGERCVLEGFREKEGEPLFFWGGGVSQKKDVLIVWARTTAGSMRFLCGQSLQTLVAHAWGHQLMDVPSQRGQPVLL